MKEVTLTELFTAIVNLTKAIEANTAAKQDTATVTVEPKEEPKETPAPTEEAEAEGVDVEAALLEVKAAKGAVEPKEEPKETPAPTEEAEAEGVALRDVEAALLEVKAAKGAATAQKLLKDITGSTSVKKADPAQYQAILDACEAALNDADEPEQVAQHGDRSKMEELIAELATSELGKGRPENFETAKRLIKKVGKADKKANIADENIQPMIEALEKAIADLKADDDL